MAGFTVALADTAFLDIPCRGGACFGVTGFATALVFGGVGGAVPVDILKGSSIRRPICPGLRKGGDFGVKIDMLYSLSVLFLLSPADTRSSVGADGRNGSMLRDETQETGPASRDHALSDPGEAHARALLEY